MLRKSPQQGVGLIFHYCVNRAEAGQTDGTKASGGRGSDLHGLSWPGSWGNSCWAFRNPESWSWWWLFVCGEGQRAGERSLFECALYLSKLKTVFTLRAHSELKPV